MDRRRRIVVIGLDGASWTVLRPRMADGRMPTLKRLCEVGATGDLLSVYPPETPAAWPSFMTGKNPGKHGVFDFLVYNPETREETPVSSSSCVGKSLWQYLSDAGKTCLVLNVPTCYPPPPVRGAVISGFLTPAGARDYAYPRELVEELERELGEYPLFFKSMAFLSASSAGSARKFLDELHAMDRVKFDVADKLFDRYQPDFTMLHIWGTDRLQHELWSWMDPHHPQYDHRMAARFDDRIESYYAMLDRRIAGLMEKAGPDAITFVISDHGFGPTHYFIDLNSWLLREGFLVLKKGLRVRIKKLLWDLGVNPFNATRVLAPLLKLLWRFEAGPPEAWLRKATGALNIPGMLNLNDVDWARTKAYAPFGWSGIYVNTRGIRPNGSVPPEETANIREQIVDRWRHLTNPFTREPVGGPVPTNPEMFDGPFAPYGPDVMPLPLDKNYMPVCFFGLTSKEPVYKNNTLFGNHRMEGILAAAGPGIRPGAVREASLMDLAPTILHLLGQAVPDDMDGRVLTTLIEPDELARRPVKTFHVEEESGVSAEGLSESEEAEIREKLMGLGYL